MCGVDHVEGRRKTDGPCAQSPEVAPRAAGLALFDNEGTRAGSRPGR
jgi:hypothetical protein